MSVLHVHAENGSDSNPGTQALPYQTLNKALGEAWLLKQVVPGQPLPLVQITVHRSATPIAPATHGGHESAGWQTTAEISAGVTHKPFPLRMVKGVDVVGSSRAQTKPEIKIDENLFGAFPGSSYEPGYPKTWVWMASNMTLFGFRLSGEEYDLSRATHALSAVYVKEVSNASIDECDIVDFHDGVYFYAGLSSDSSTQLTVSGSVRNSHLENFFPTVADPLLPQDKGHAAVWLKGPGILDVDIISCDFEECHDAIQTGGEIESGLATEANLDVIGGTFVGIENGIEVVGKGRLTFTATDSTFLRCKNLPEGVDPNVSSTAAMLLRGMNTLNGMVRGCTFENNAYSILWNLNPTAPSTLNLGTSLDHGLNVFKPFDFNIPLSEDTYRVHVVQKSIAGLPTRISAWGNTWIPGNQGADAAGCLTSASVLIGPTNLPNLLVNDGPPGPFAGEFDSIGVPWSRNYSILEAGGELDVGEDCP